MTKSYALTFLLSLLLVSAISQVTINELVFTPESGHADGGTTAGEWVELYGPPGTDISCYILTDGDWTATIPSGTIIGADGLYVIGNATYANSPGPDGSTPVDLDLETCNCTNSEPNKMDLANTGEFVALFDGSTAPPSFLDGLIFGTPTGSDTPSGNTTISSAAISGCASVKVDIGGNASNFQTVNDESGGAMRLTDGVGVWEEIAPQDMSPNGSNSGLPIQLVYFEVEKQRDYVRLFWETAQEIDNHFFVLEHSKDGITFFEIGQMLGAGTSDVVLQYEFFHEEVEKGINYYRLKQVDFDEKYEYSAIRSIHFLPAMDDLIQVFPTIIKDNLSIQSEGYFGQNAMYQIFDISGRKIESGILEEESDWKEINTSTWHSGYYVIQVIQNNTSVSKRVIK